MTSAVEEQVDTERHAPGDRARTKRPEPNFFIVGAPKAGTTSLYAYLRQHPDVFMPENKEPFFFCGVHELAASHGLAYQARPVCPDLDSYLSLFASAGDRPAVGEASVSYLAAVGAEERLHAQFPDGRIIIALRNPADRAYSWYNFMCQYGVEPGLSFEDALADEDRRMAVAAERRETWFADELILYYRFGLIAHDIERWVRRFDRDQILFVLIDDLRARPVETVRRVFEFLGVDPAFVPSFKVYNPTWFPLSVRLQHFFMSRCRLHPIVPSRGPIRRFDRFVAPKVCELNSILGQLRRRRFNPATRRALLDRYREDIHRTQELTGLNLSNWLKTA